MVKKAIFFDRDGVVNVEVSYLCEPDKTELIPGCAEAIRKIHEAGFLAIAVTNQSGIARNMYTVDDMMSVHARIQKLLLAEGADCTVDAFYFCPHHKDFSGECSCRKPAPGMLMKAAEDFNIDLENSYMIGDRLSDLHAGSAANCKNCILVKTGYGENEVGKAREANFAVAEDLLDAVNHCLGEELPLITIGVSAYNREFFLPECLDSLLAQSYPNIEIIVIDDGSKDNTKQLVTEKYPQVRYIYKENGGDASAKNRAAREAKGEYIVFNDSDDVFLPDAVERLYKAMVDGQAQYGREVIAYGTYEGIDENSVRYPAKSKVAVLPSGNITENLLKNVLVCSTGVLLPVKSFLADGGYDESLRCMHDWKLSLELSLEFPFTAVQEPVFLRRRHSSNLSAASYRGSKTALDVFEEFVAANPELSARFGKVIRRRRATLHSRLAREAAKEKSDKKIIHEHLKTALANHFTLKHLVRYIKNLM